MPAQAHWLDAEWAPREVVPRISYWAFNYSQPGVERALTIVMVLFAVLSLIHLGMDIYSQCFTRSKLIMKLTSPYFCLVELPSIFAALSVEWFRDQLSVAEWILLVAAIEVLQLVRLFEEGHVLPPFTVLVRTMEAAFYDIAMLGMAMVPALVLFALIYGQLFGVFSADFKDVPSSLSNVWARFTVGQEAMESELLDYNPVGAHIMYYASCLLLYLILSQFFVAILVGTLHTSKRVKSIEERNEKLPGDYQTVAKRSHVTRSPFDLAIYMLTYYYYKSFAPRLIRHLKVAIVLAETKNDAAKEDQVMLNYNGLAAAVGCVAARELMLRHGARRRGYTDSANRAHLYFKEKRPMVCNGSMPHHASSL